MPALGRQLCYWGRLSKFTVLILRFRRPCDAASSFRPAFLFVFFFFLHLVCADSGLEPSGLFSCNIGLLCMFAALSLLHFCLQTLVVCYVTPVLLILFLWTPENFRRKQLFFSFFLRWILAVFVCDRFHFRNRPTLNLGNLKLYFLTYSVYENTLVLLTLGTTCVRGHVSGSECVEQSTAVYMVF